MEPTKIAIDLAKRVFLVHFVDPEIGAIRSKTPKRAKLIPFFTNCPRSRVALEMDRADKQSLRPHTVPYRNGRFFYCHFTAAVVVNPS
ncbi:hypothetical protein SAMN05446635_1051 [Burkholderia sp. OK233]|nr:hypothetical protein SAMN05446635_1051 [Burkholderia sp. OK233]